MLIHPSSHTDVVTAYINDLRSQLGLEDDEMEPEPEEEAAEEAEEADDMGDEPPFPPVYQEGDDFDKAADLKQKAADCKSSGDWDGALEAYTAAVLAAAPSPLLLANRATALLKLGRPRAAVRDCDQALQENPDSAKALRVRGKARKELGQWEAALQDLSASQQIDFDEGTVEDLKFLTEKHVEQEKTDAAKRNEEEERLRKKAADIKKAQAEAKREAEEEQARSSAAGGFPGGGGGGMPGGMGGMGGMPGMGGMGGMPGMADIMKDPELVAAMQNPKVMNAFMEAQSNPAKLMELMSDPEVGPVLQKLMAKLQGGGMGGMGGGMPGAGFGAGGGGANEDDVPNLDEMDEDVDLDDLPDLE